MLGYNELNRIIETTEKEKLDEKINAWCKKNKVTKTGNTRHHINIIDEKGRDYQVHLGYVILNLNLFMDELTDYVCHDEPIKIH